MKTIATEGTAALPGLDWPIGDFYVPTFSSDGRTALVPGAADTHRRVFLIRASRLEPELLATLRKVGKSKRSLPRWARRWHLTDPWCVRIALDTLHWWAANPQAGGWEFEGTAIFPGFFPFKIEPLQFGPFYYDPTWRRRLDFERNVRDQVNRGLTAYCDQVEADALRAGLKIAPRKRGLEHFDWLVRYQIKGESFASISRRSSYKFSGGRQTIRKAVVELAGYLALTLRAST
jgi:hypothetical protein